MRRSCTVVVLALLLAAVTVGQEKEQERLKECCTVISEILNVPEGIPQDLLDKAECVVVFPSVKKFAIGIGGSYGRGALICRGGENYDGPWGAPAMYALEAGNIGLQLGGQATDFVLLVMNPRGAKSVLTSKVKLGADAAAAAGPKGRDYAAATDIVMKAEILSYSRSRGLFAGISLEGSTLRLDGGANKNLYGKELSAKNIVLEGAVESPAAASCLISILNKKSPKNRSASQPQATPQPAAPETAAPATPQPAAPETAAPATPQPAAPETAAPATSQPAAPETAAPVTPQPAAPETGGSRMSPLLWIVLIILLIIIVVIVARKIREKK